ncbi:hypothetical protein [Bradyrhizobium sp. sBnM-33]|uniref:hypothetical protein n=1 Tax=Bradyrhizobium sp. sBnM-33 TaxID=2831780 RepID=UPI0020C0CD5E|nr:hypothetical protein [Bradyrhizobium sp. sBnM-33]WOH54862.1 hypothetical protein RX328_17275 [Bradyrhizobium sp. sBnM-33]
MRWHDGPATFSWPFQKYLLVLFLAAAVPLAINGTIEAWFGYRDQHARLDQLLGIQATSAAARIQGFIEHHKRALLVGPASLD